MTEPELLPAQSTSKVDEDPAKSKQTTTTDKPGSHSALWLVIVINFVLAVLLAGGAAWFWFNYYQPLKQRVETQQLAGQVLDQVKQEQTRQLSVINQVEREQQSLGVELAGVNASAQTLTQQLSNIQQTLDQQDGERTSDWLIAEADYLTRMAGRKLWLESDTNTAIKLLQEADKRIAETGDPTLLSVRTSIASDIQRIEQINPVSTVSVALSISGLLSTVDNLPLDALQLPESVTPSPAPVSENVSDWRENLGRVWDSLMDDFVSVRRREAPVEPMMTQAQSFIAKERVKLSLMQAQSAALGNQVTLYQQSLQQVVAGLVEHFDLQNHQVEQFLSAIDNLQSTNVEKAIPEQLRAQEALRQALTNRERQIRSGSYSL